LKKNNNKIKQKNNDLPKIVIHSDNFTSNENNIKNNDFKNEDDKRIILNKQEDNKEIMSQTLKSADYINYSTRNITTPKESSSGQKVM